MIAEKLNVSIHYRQKSQAPLHGENADAQYFRTNSFMSSKSLALRILVFKVLWPIIQ